jgi:hypothetical protein
MPASHRNASYVYRPCLVGKTDGFIPQQIRKFPARFVGLGQIGPGINSVNAHLTHIPNDQLSANSQAIFTLQQLPQLPRPGARQNSMPIIYPPLDPLFQLQSFPVRLARLFIGSPPAYPKQFTPPFHRQTTF